MFIIVVVMLVLFLNSDAFQLGRHLERTMLAVLPRVSCPLGMAMKGMEEETHIPVTTIETTKMTMRKSLAVFSAYVAGMTAVVTTVHPSAACAITLPECSDEITILKSSNNDREVVLIGTAHISEESVALVSKVINDLRPDTVMIELDPKRLGKVGKNDQDLQELGFDIHGLPKQQPMLVKKPLEFGCKTLEC